MKNRESWLAMIPWTLSACAVYELPPLSTNHPANPAAMAAPERQVSRTLEYGRADMPSPFPVTAAAAAKPGGHEGHHPMKTATDKAVTGEGHIVATVPSSNQVVVEHGEIKGFMDAMTMGYRVEPVSLLEGLKPGDRVRFTIDVQKKIIVTLEKLK